MSTSTPQRARGRRDPPNLEARHNEHATRHATLHTTWKTTNNLPSAYDCSALCTPIKDQGSCGSCWDFSGTAIVESALILAKTLPNNSTASQLSEQYTLDACDGSNGGCGGDDNTTVLADANTGGLPLTSDYGPYQGRHESCKWPKARINARQIITAPLWRIADWGYVGPQAGVPTTTEIKNAMMQYGPLGAAVAADNAFEAWGHYLPEKSKPFLGSGSTNIDHDIVLCGWDDAINAWLLRNSWSTSWGIDGYMWIAYSANRVGYEAVWATAGITPPPPPPPPPPPTPPPHQPCPPHVIRAATRITAALHDLAQALSK